MGEVGGWSESVGWRGRVGERDGGEADDDDDGERWMGGATMDGGFGLAWENVKVL